MCDEQSISDNVFELNDVVVSYNPAPTCLGDLLGWEDLPLVVRVIVRVTGDLLTLRTDSPIIVSQWVLVDMRM